MVARAQVLPFPSLELDRWLTEQLRVRSWYQQSRPSPPWPAGAHALYEIAWVEEGGLVYRIGSREHVVSAGTALVVPREVEHQTSARPGTRAVSIWLGPALIAQVGDAVGVDPRALDTGALPDPRRLVVLGRLLLEEAEQRAPGQALAADALGEAVALEALRARTAVLRAAGPRDPRIRAATERVEACFAEPLTVEDLARTAGMSRYHFSRLFREQTGHSPYQFIVQRRLRAAAQLLRRGRCGVTEAALSAGFTELGRFSRQFRQQLGCLPSQYAQQRTGGLRP